MPEINLQERISEAIREYERHREAMIRAETKIRTYQDLLQLTLEPASADSNDADNDENKP